MFNINFIILFIKGIFVGVANIIPGVSGGTLAVVLNIFDKLIYSINNLFKDFKKSILFLIPIGLGAVFGIVAFSSLIEFGLTEYSLPTNLLFVGLVAGSIPLIYRNAISKERKSMDLVLGIGAFLVVVLLSYIESHSVETASTESFLSIKLFLAGVIASSAMIIPGISGSFLLMLMGLYDNVIFALSSIKDYLLDVTNISLMFQIIGILLPMAIGIVIGVFLVSKVIEIAFTKAYSTTYYIILGLILGSIYSIFANPDTYASGVSTTLIIISGVTFAIGFLVAIFLGKE